MNDTDSSPIKRPLGASDAPKIALGATLFLLLLGAAWTLKSRANVNNESARMITQMKLELGTLDEDDQFLSPAAADEAQEKRQESDPNFRP